MKRMLTYFLYTTILAFSLSLSAMMDKEEEVVKKAVGLKLDIDGNGYVMGYAPGREVLIIISRDIDDSSEEFDVSELDFIAINDPIPGIPNGRRGLHIAVQAGYKALNFLSKMIEGGVNLDIGDDNGLTPLIYALKVNNTEGAIKLIEGGATVNKSPKPCDLPLDIARRYNAAPAVIEMLIEYGAKEGKLSDVKIEETD